MTAQSDIDFWGSEVLAENETVAIAMEADSDRITLFLKKVTAPGHHAWLTLSYPDWTALRGLLRRALPSGGIVHDTPGFGSLERMGRREIGLTVGTLTLCMPVAHFRQLKQAVALANQRILKARRRRPQ